MEHGETSLDVQESLLERHRQEKKDLIGKYMLLSLVILNCFPFICLTAKTTKLRHSVLKNDKKRKKEINTEIENLEQELKARHEKELKELSDSQSRNHNSMQVSTNCGEQDNEIEFKVPKSHRRRDNKERKERERQGRIKAGQIDDSENIRKLGELI